MTTQPEPAHVWVEDRDWRLVSAGDAHHCCYRLCGGPAVAELSRRHGRGRRWWAYCADHLYGRRIANGRVEVAVHPESLAAKQGHVGGEARP